MPGHKRNLTEILISPARYDVTEVEWLDEYHTPSGIIKDAQKNAAKIYGVLDSFFLVNGSTSGVMAAIASSCEPGGRILLARNCHISAYNAAELMRLHISYVMPETENDLNVYGEVKAEKVEEALNRWRDIEAVVITSPTYEGIVSDISAIAEVVHRYGKILIVDEAHGAHLRFMSEKAPKLFPKSAVESGADIVIQSLHKTLPAFTQSAIIHRISDRVGRDELFHRVSMFQSTSPSYLLMAGMDHAIHYAYTNDKQIEEYIENLSWIREELEKLEHISLFEGDGLDKGKLVIRAKDVVVSGEELHSMLKDKGQIPEMYGGDHVLLMTSMMDERGAFEKLLSVIKDIDEKLGSYDALSKEGFVDDKLFESFYPDTACGVHEAIKRRADSVYVSVSEADGHIAADYVYAYPPGIPLLAPGELITEEVKRIILQGIERKLNLKGIRSKNGDHLIEVL